MITIIIVEGFDGSGKTTLCKYISNKYNIPVTRSPGPKTRKEMISWIRKCIIDPPELLDRFTLISERVYGPVLRGKCALSDHDIYILEELLVKVNPLIIFCSPSIETILHGMLFEDHMEGVRENCDKLIVAYDEIILSLIMKGVFKVIKYNRDTTSVEFLDDLIKVELAGPHTWESVRR